MIRVDPKDVPGSRNAFLTADEVIVVRSGAYTGDVAQVTETWAGAVAGYDLVITPGKGFCGEYLESYLLTNQIQKNYFGNIKARAGQPHLNSTQLSNTLVLQPPLDEQRRFREKVRAIRTFRQNWYQSERLIQTLFQSLLHSSFSGD
jgi:type I restriction enzyme S subunit